MSKKYPHTRAATAANASTQKMIVMTVHRPTRRLSRSSTASVTARGSVGWPYASQVNSDWPSSFSVTGHRPFQLAAQGQFGVMQPRSHGADRTVDHAGDVGVGHLFQKPQHQHLAELRGQHVERGVYPRDILGRELVAVVRFGDVVGEFEHSRLWPLSIRSHGAVAGHSIHPRREGGRVSQLR